MSAPLKGQHCARLGLFTNVPSLQTQESPLAPRPATRREAAAPNMDESLVSLSFAPDNPNS